MKLFAMTLVLGLAGVVYAAGQMQDAGHQNHGAQSADKPSCCQAGHQKDGQKAAQKDGQKAAMSCDKDGCCQGHAADGGCCKGHKAGAQQASATAGGESCCGGACGKDGGCCKGHQHKAGAAATVVKTSAGADAPSCCGAGAACCKDGADCCKGHKTATAAGQKQEGGCDCCGDSCAMHTGR
jgi:hypothetical protein